MYRTEISIKISLRYGEAAKYVSIPLTYERSVERHAAEQATHAQRLAQQRARSAEWVREGAGHVGAGRLGNELMEASYRQDEDAKAKALAALGLAAWEVLDSHEAIEARVRELSGIPPQHVVL